MNFIVRIAKNVWPRLFVNKRAPVDRSTYLREIGLFGQFETLTGGLINTTEGIAIFPIDPAEQLYVIGTGEILLTIS